MGGHGRQALNTRERQIDLLRLAGHVVSASPIFVSLFCTFFIYLGVLGISWGNLLGYLTMLIGSWAAANFFLEIVEYRSRGESNWPAFSMETVASAQRQIGVFFALITAAFGVGYYLLVSGGWVQISQLYIAGLTIALPAIAALLAVTRSLWRALNPLALVSAMYRMGLPYGICVLAGLAVAALFFNAYSSPGFVSLFVFIYVAFLLAYLLGSTLYQRRARLGVYAPRAPEVRAAREHSALIARRQMALNRAYSFAVRGNKRGAIADIESYLRSDEDTAEARLWVFHQMSGWEDPTTALMYGNELIERLEAADGTVEAQKLRLRCEYLKEQLGMPGPVPGSSA